MVDRSRRVALDNAAPEQSKDAKRATATAEEGTNLTLTISQPYAPSRLLEIDTDSPLIAAADDAI